MALPILVSTWICLCRDGKVTEMNLIKLKNSLYQDSLSVLSEL